MEKGDTRQSWFGKLFRESVDKNNIGGVDSAGSIMMDPKSTLRASILDSAAGGGVVYSEIQNRGFALEAVKK